MRSPRARKSWATGNEVDQRRQACKATHKKVANLGSPQTSGQRPAAGVGRRPGPYFRCSCPAIAPKPNRQHLRIGISQISFRQKESSQSIDKASNTHERRSTRSSLAYRRTTADSRLRSISTKTETALMPGYATPRRPGQTRFVELALELRQLAFDEQIQLVLQLGELALPD